MDCKNFECRPNKNNDCEEKYYTDRELFRMQIIPDIYPPQKRGPPFVQVQQAPQVVCQKKVIYTKRTVIDKHVVPQTKEICEARLVYQPKVIYEPYVVYKKRVVPEPKIVYSKRVVTDPKVVCQTRTIVDPIEIGQSILCQPKAQTIRIPEPQEFTCAPTGTAYINNPGCPPCLPLGKEVNPCPTERFDSYLK